MLSRTTRSWIVLAQSLVVCLAVAPPVLGHGLHGHVHVTGWAIENLPPGELKTMFADPDVVKAALSGAMFPDTGYALDRPGARDYGEYAHWEPFIERFIQRVRENHGPTYDTKEEHLLVAFLLGCAAHGLQDELFDSTFLFEAEERDGHGQEATDPATDGFLVVDGYFRLLPGDYFPIDEMLPLFQIFSQPIDHALIDGQISLVRNAYVNDLIGPLYARNEARKWRPQLPWTSANYLQFEVPGSLAAEVEPTMRHMQALWERLNGRFDDSQLVVHAWPDAPRRLRAHTHQNVASWITLVLGKGIEENSATTRLVDGAGTAQDYRLRYTRWGGTSRIVRFQPTADLVPGADYTAVLEAGARLVDGSTTATAQEHHFRVECSNPEDARCPVEPNSDPVLAQAPATPTPSPTATRSPAPTRTPTIAMCAGDCSLDRQVTIDEVLRCVTIALGSPLTCQPCDLDRDGEVAINELVTAVNAALGGCPAL